MSLFPLHVSPDMEWLPNALRTLRAAHNTRDKAEFICELKDVLEDFKMLRNLFRKSLNFDMKVEFAYGLTSFCVEYEIKDGEVIEQVLECVWELLGDFSVIHNRISFRGNQPRISLLYGTVSDNVLQKFFVEQSNKLRITFYDDGDEKRLVDLQTTPNFTPLKTALLRSDPIKTELLLRYGAGLSSGLDSIKAESLFCLTLLFVTLHDEYNFSVVDYNNLPVFESCDIDYVKTRLVPSLRFLLRAVRHFGTTTTTRPISLVASPGVVVRNPVEFYRALSLKGYLPALLERLVNPASLKHQCRCVLRKTLNDTWQLPYGIKALGMPKCLVDYLDLQTD